MPAAGVRGVGAAQERNGRSALQLAWARHGGGAVEAGRGLSVDRGGALDGAGEREADRDTAFAHGLARILDGVQTLVDRRA